MQFRETNQDFISAIEPCGAQRIHTNGQTRSRQFDERASKDQDDFDLEFRNDEARII